ncbi:MAG TPA: hypothetical protein VFU15_16035, partial [Bacteroidia bacterium]|nr:hypothetical protein [Bacteroidia bacterium]
MFAHDSYDSLFFYYYSAGISSLYPDTSQPDFPEENFIHPREENLVLPGNGSCLLNNTWTDYDNTGTGFSTSREFCLVRKTKDDENLVMISFALKGKDTVVDRKLECRYLFGKRPLVFVLRDFRTGYIDSSLYRYSRSGLLSGVH